MNLENKQNRGFCALEFSKCLLFELFYFKKQPWSAEGDLKLLFMDTNSILFSINSNQSKLINVMEHFCIDLDLSVIFTLHEIIPTKEKKVTKNRKLNHLEIRK